MDNTTEYQRIRRNTIKGYILRSRSPTQDIATRVCHLYKYQYKYNSIKSDIWYEFSDHEWIQIEKGYTLRNKIIDNVADEYIQIVSDYNNNKIENSKQNVEQMNINMKISKNVTSVANKLRNMNYTGIIMKQCQIMFYDPDFESLLNRNPDIIGYKWSL